MLNIKSVHYSSKIKVLNSKFCFFRKDIWDDLNTKKNNFDLLN